MKNYLLAVFTLIGTIVGVGMFALPYVVVKSGVLLFILYMPILVYLQYYLHMLYSEIVLSTKGNRRLPGYVGHYGSRSGKIVTLILALVSDYGALLAYIIMGGIFLYQLASPFLGGGVVLYTSVLFFIEAYIVLHGLKMIAGSEFFMTGFMIAVIGLIIWRGQEYVSIDNFTWVDWKYGFYPYGPIFFSIGGMAAIPEVCKLLANQKEKIKSAIAWGTFLSAGIMTAFILAIVGMTGDNTTTDALQGLATVFGNGILKLALVCGILAIVTSMIAIAQACREVFWWDFKMNKNLAWILACAVPYLIYLAGARDLTKIVSLTGAFSGGALGMATIYVVLKIKKKRDQKSLIVNNINKPIAYALYVLFILGIVYEIWANTK